LCLIEALEEVSQSQEILHLKGCATSSQHDTGIRRHKARPGCWEGPHLIRGLVKGDTVFTPIVAIIEDLKLLPVQGMEGMGNGEKPFR
jgi:hypothetical protein